jgi:hypothetical protein
MTTRAQRVRRLEPRRATAFATLVLGFFAASLLADRSVSYPYVGVTYVDRTELAPRPWHAHLVQIDLAPPGVRLQLSAPVGPREVVRQTTRESLAAQGAQIALNAHFFLPWPSTDLNAEAIGIGASDGRVFSAFEVPMQAYALAAYVPGINIDKNNHATLVHRDPADATGRKVLEDVELWTTVSGSAQMVTDGVVTIPEYRDAAHPLGALAPGGPNGYSNEKSWYDAVNARTAIGLSRDGRTLTLLTVDARGGSDGLTVREVAQVLVRDYDVWQALNLDGGGSTSMAMADPVTGAAMLVNASSDGPAGRSVATNLLVFAPKRAGAH